MLFIIGLVVCLLLLGFLADKLAVPLWGWLLLLAGSVSFSLLLISANWLWYLLVLAPSLAMTFPQVRLNLIVHPLISRIISRMDLLGPVALHNNNNNHTAYASPTHGLPMRDDWLSDIMQTCYDSSFSSKATSISATESNASSIAPLGGKELKIIYQYYHRLQTLGKKRMTHNAINNTISATEILQEIKQAAALGIDTAYGGEGLSVQARCLLVLKLAAVQPQLAAQLSAMNCGIQSLLAQYGSSRQKEQLLPAIATAEILCHTLDPQVSHAWLVTQAQKSITNTNNGKTKLVTGVEISDIAQIEAAIKQLDANLSKDLNHKNLIAIYVNVKSSIKSSIKSKPHPTDNSSSPTIPPTIPPTTLPPHYGGCWILLDDKTINSIKETINDKPANKEPAPLFIPDGLIISDATNIISNEDNEDDNPPPLNKKLLNTYISEKALYDLALTTANNLVGAHKSSSSMANLIAKSAGNQQLLGQNQITAAANQWQEAWLFKKLRNIHLQQHLQEQTSDIIDNLICYEKSEPPWMSPITPHILELNPNWVELVEVATSSTSDNQQLAATDNWLGDFISRMLKIFYLGALSWVMPLVLLIYGKVYEKSERTAAKPTPNLLTRYTPQYELLKNAFALLVDCSVITNIVAGKATNLLAPLQHLYYAYVTLVGTADTDASATEEPRYLAHFRSSVLFKCKQQLHQAFRGLQKDSPMPVAALSWLSNALILLSPSQGLASMGENYRTINDSSIPSQERNDFFAEIELASPPLVSLEEKVKTAWLVREIYSNLEDKGYSFKDEAHQDLSVQEWYEELYKAELITSEDKAILDDFHKNQ